MLILLCIAVLMLWAAMGCGEEATETGTETGELTRGGTLRYASQEVVNIDPAVMSTGPDYQFGAQVYDQLIEVDGEGQLQPRLAETWETTDAKTWTFKLREGVVFHDGSTFTAADVIYTFERLQNPDTGSNLVDVFANVESMEAVDDYTLVITLKEPYAEFPLAAATPPQAAILPEDLVNPSETAVGTGPFVVESYEPQVRAVLKANPSYWRTSEAGEKLPYLDAVEIIYSPELAGQVEALRSGELDFVGGLAFELGETVKDDPSVKILRIVSNLHYAIHMNCERGPAKDERVRLALRLGTDTAAMAGLYPDFAEAGNGTCVGPAYDYFIDQPPPYDPEKAKQLLAEAGYADGLEITLQVQNAYGVPAIGTLWKEQMEQIGVTANLQVVPQDVYYGDGENNWLDSEFGVTDWGPRPAALMYFQLSYITGAPWSGAKWSDAEFDEVCEQIMVEVDDEKRADLYRRAQEILIERQPVIIPYFETSVCVTGPAVSDVALAPDWSQTSFEEVWIAQ